MVVEGEDSAAPVAPERADFVTDTARTAYTFWSGGILLPIQRHYLAE